MNPEALAELQDHEPGRFLIVDLEATCWRGPPPQQNEIIEIGAAIHDRAAGTGESFQTFVKPKLTPALSDFCRQLTGIRQEEVDAAPSFPAALESFLRWADAHKPWTFASWGAYDAKQFEKDCALHEIPYPFPEHLNLKRAFAVIHRIKPCGMTRALDVLGLSLEGAHHRGLDDARNIARILDSLLNLRT